VTVTAPPRPPQSPGPSDLVGWGDPEALIAEARQRARRRRRRYAAIVAVLAVLATSVIGFLGRPDPSQRLSPAPPPTLPIPPDPNDATSIVAKYGKVHVGWVVVYGDGRVIKMRDSTGDLFERRLTAKGLDLVRSGAIQPRPLLPAGHRWWDCIPMRRIPGGTSDCVEITRDPAEVWADAEAKPYVPSRYAACLGTTGDPGFSGIPPGQATEMVGRLPAAARALLRDKELRTYSKDLFSHSEINPPDHSADTLPPDPPVECFEVSTQEAIVLFKTLRQAGFAFAAPPWTASPEPGIFRGFLQGHIRPQSAPPPPWAGEVRGPCGGIKQPAAIVCFTPLLPHGQWYDMPG
jgi:hypothetical protein